MTHPDVVDCNPRGARMIGTRQPTSQSQSSAGTLGREGLELGVLSIRVGHALCGYFMFLLCRFPLRAVCLVVGDAHLPLCASQFRGGFEQGDGQLRPMRRAGGRDGITRIDPEAYAFGYDLGLLPCRLGER